MSPSMLIMTSQVLLFALPWVTATMATAMNDLDIPERPPIIIQKCCAGEEIINKAGHCQHMNETGISAWKPKFTTEDGKDSPTQPYFELVRI